MNSITSGVVTIQNISKFWDYAIPALLFILAGVLQYFFFSKKKEERDIKESSARLLKGLPLGLTAAYCFYILGKSLNFPEIELSIFSLALAGLVTYFVMNSKVEVSTGVQFGMALIALNLKILTTQGNLSILILLNAVALLLVLKGRVELLLAIVSIIIFKKFDFGPYLISDLFHSSEFITSYPRGLNSLGEWNVFPNIGYLEEAIPNLIVDIFYASTLGYVQLSIQDAYSLGLIFLTGGMYYFLEKRWKGVAYALTTLFVAERLTLILVVNLGLFLSSLRNSHLTWLALGFTPLLLVGLSPPYGAIFVLAVALFFLRNKPNLKLLLPSLLLLVTCLAFYGDILIYFLKIYKDWGGVNSAAHGTPMWGAPTFKTVFRLVFILSLSLLIWQLIDGEVFGLYGYIAMIGIALSLWMYLNYGFTRLDKGTGSRIFPVGLAIFAVIIPYLKRYTKAIPVILCVSFFGASFASPRVLGEIDLFRLSPKMTMNQKSQLVLDKYQSVAHKLGGEVILFSNQPVLANYIPEAKVPPFSSPWVAVGELPQSQIIDFFKANPSLPLVLGDDFLTWDGVDVRARSPHIYKFIAQHYRQVMIDGIVVAIPSNEMKMTEFFSGFDIGEAATYYAQHKNVIDVTVQCDGRNPPLASYKIHAEKNEFFARLHCGVNKVPDVYFLGQYLNVSPRSTDDSNKIHR